MFTGFGLDGVVFKLDVEVGALLITSESDPVALRRIIFLAVSCKETLCLCRRGGASESLLFVIVLFSSLTARCFVSDIIIRESDYQHSPSRLGEMVLLLCCGDLDTCTLALTLFAGTCFLTEKLGGDDIEHLCPKSEALIIKGRKTTCMYVRTMYVYCCRYILLYAINVSNGTPTGSCSSGDV